MCGNVWEWTSSPYLPYSSSSPYLPYSYSPNGHRKDPEQAEVRRVLRGGSWYYGRGFARCTYRLGFLPGYRSGYLGLRLVCLSPGVQTS